MGGWLYSVKVKELIYIKKFINNLANKLYGLVFNLIKSEIGIMFFGSTKRITVGQFIYRSKKRLKVPVDYSTFRKNCWWYNYSYGIISYR